ncbi:unnamed protein product [Moneuplotes crassus]|uniref:WD repeat-containing protein 65 n=1 Tax=Euplotes crassus TaxID=5936 RepID=A0AAD2DD19_EUPCR|nr:unnamed protein product [Moneuplotes crassus]
MFANKYTDDDEIEEEITDPLTIINKERDIQRLLLSNNKSMRPDLLDRLRATVSPLIVNMALNSKNLTNVVLKKVYGIYRKPVNTNLHFVDKNTCVFLVSNHLAVHNLQSDVTQYIELSTNIYNPTSIFCTQCKEEPLAKRGSLEESKEDSGADFDNPISTVPSLFAYAEECRVADEIPANQKLNIKTIITKTKKLKTPSSSSPSAGKGSPRAQKVVYVANVTILRLFDSQPPKSYTLSHAFYEKFDVKQIFIKAKENLVYTLCENEEQCQFITVWNFKKHLICYKQLPKYVCKFVVYPHKADYLLMLGTNYFKSWDINFTNKSIKENSNPLITMRLEKENEFVDLEFIKGTESFILLSKTGNQIFVFEKKTLVNQLANYKETSAKEESEEDSFVEKLDFSEDEEERKGKARFIGAKGEKIRLNKGHDASIKDKIGGHGFLNNENALSEPEFECLVATNKYLIIGMKQGYIIVFEKSIKNAVKFVGKVRLGERYITVKELCLNKSEDILGITAVCPYQVEECETTETENNENMSKFSPPDNKDPEKTKDGKTFLFTHKKTISTKKEYKFKERVEILYVPLKSLISSLTHAQFRKVFDKGIHNGCIYDMSVCRNKSVLVSLGEDAVKVFNHSNEWTTHNTFEFEDQPLCINLHPSGSQIAVGFKTGTRLYQQLDNELKLSFEKFGKATITIAYSHGGHLLAANSSCYIDIIDPIRLQMLYTLWGHKGVVRSLYWTPDSKYLVSTCNCGGIFFWRGNFKDFGYNKGQDEIEPVSSFYDETSFFYSCFYDQSFDCLITLTSHSVLKIFRDYGKTLYHEDHLNGFTANCMEFSKELSIIALGTTDGCVIFKSWPILEDPELNRTFLLNLDTHSITNLKFSSCYRFLFVSCDNGNIYSLICSASDKLIKFPPEMDFSNHFEDSALQVLQKRREVNNFKGFSNTDNLALINNFTLYKVNDKISKLQEQIKTLVVKYKEELRKIIKRCKKHKKMIEDELESEKQKQTNLYEETIEKNRAEITRLQNQLDNAQKAHDEKTQEFVESKEKLLNYVLLENDDLEREILKLNDNIIKGLNKEEARHREMIEELVKKYEQSRENMKDEITSTVKKLKESAGYYEEVLGGAEEVYELEIESNEKTKEKQDAQSKALTMESQVNDTKYTKHLLSIEHEKNEKLTQDCHNDLVKEKDFLKQITEKISNTLEKTENCQKLIGLKKIHIEHFQKEKNNLENLIIVLSNRIQELSDETEPLRNKKKELENTVKNAYNELIHEFNTNKLEDLKVESYDKKIRVLKETITVNTKLHSSILTRMTQVLRELHRIGQTAEQVSAVSGKVTIILENLNILENAKTSKDIESNPLKFPKVSTPPWKTCKDKNDINIYTQNELSRQRDDLHKQINEEVKAQKNYHKKKEMKKSKKILQDNVKLLEEFNYLNFENKKIRDHQKLIEMFMETVLGKNNYKRMLMSIENDAIMGKPKKAPKPMRHKRKASGHQPNVPKLNGEDAKNSSRGFDPKTFKAILEEFDKNKQNVADQNKVMEDIQNKMMSVAKEFNLKRFVGINADLENKTNPPLSSHSGSQSHRVLPGSTTPDSSEVTNFVPLTGRSSDIRNKAKLEIEKAKVEPKHMRKRSLPSIKE